MEVTKNVAALMMQRNVSVTTNVAQNQAACMTKENAMGEQAAHLKVEAALEKAKRNSFLSLVCLSKEGIYLIFERHSLHP